MNAPAGFSCYLFWNEIPKVLEEDEWPSRKNVNSGFTTPYSNEIFVYRAEEYQRVVIHETIHALGLDWNISTSSPLYKRLESCWKLNNDSYLYPHLFEAWTELYSEWIYCVFFSKDNDVLGVSWDCQRVWQDQQAVQILCRLKNISTIKSPTWKEDTNVFAYYVLKACLAPYISLLLLTKIGHSEEETLKILCTYVHKRLSELKASALKTMPKKIPLTMINTICFDS